MQRRTKKDWTRNLEHGNPRVSWMITNLVEDFEPFLVPDGSRSFVHTMYNGSLGSHDNILENREENTNDNSSIDPHYLDSDKSPPDRCVF